MHWHMCMLSVYKNVQNIVNKKLFELDSVMWYDLLLCNLTHGSSSRVKSHTMCIGELLVPVSIVKVIPC